MFVIAWIFWYIVDIAGPIHNIKQKFVLDEEH